MPDAGHVVLPPTAHSKGRRAAKVHGKLLCIAEESLQGLDLPPELLEPMQGECPPAIAKQVGVGTFWVVVSETAMGSVHSQHIACQVLVLLFMGLDILYNGLFGNLYLKLRTAANRQLMLRACPPAIDKHGGLGSLHYCTKL